MNQQKKFTRTYLYMDVVRSIPYSFLIILTCRFCLAAAPSVVLVLSAGMFNGAAAILNGEAAYTYILPYILGYLGIYLVLDQISMFANLAVNKRLYEYCNTKYKVNLSKKASRLSLRSLDADQTEDLKRKAMNCVEEKAIPSSIEVMIDLFFSIFSIVSVILILAQYSLWFLPVAACSVIPYFIIRTIRGKEYFQIREHQVKSERMKDYLWTLFSDKRCIKELHTMGFGSYLFNKWADTNRNVNEEIWAHNIREQKSNLLCEFLRIAGYFISVGLTLALTLDGTVSISALGACIMAFQTVQNQMSDAFARAGESAKFASFTTSYCTFMNLDEETQGTLQIGQLESISVNKLIYQYPNGIGNALYGLNLTIRRGEKIALIGENGSGKTTFVKCLMGIYPSFHGSVVYNGHDIAEIVRPSEQFGVVEQNVVKYYFTVRDVMLMGSNRFYPDEELVQALDKVGLGCRLNGENSSFLDQQLGAEFGGAELSGGEWQRLALARCVLRKPEFLVLDEPTSALDPLAESELLLKMLSITNNATTLIISHRVGICRNVDRIIVMKNGRITETGSHEELICQDGEYRKLYEMQRKWYI